MPRYYLLRCLEQFEAVIEDRYGEAYDLRRIEGEAAHLRSATRIRLADLRPITASPHWEFARFWATPSAADVDPRLEDKTFDFHRLREAKRFCENEQEWKWVSEEEREVIAALFAAFRSIDHVSILLRFVKPESFGILSPPVERVLDVRRGSDAVETYCNYLQNLRAIRNHYPGLDRAADADMALWVLHEKCFSPQPDPDIQRAYEADPFMLEIRAKNLVAPLKEVPLPPLAKALHNVRNDLAALAACYEFERAVRGRAKSAGIPLTKRTWDQKTLDCTLYDLINDLSRKRRITSPGMWHRLRKIRNEILHRGIATVPSGDIKDLVEGTLRLSDM